MRKKHPPYPLLRFRQLRSDVGEIAISVTSIGCYYKTELNYLSQFFDQNMREFSLSRDVTWDGTQGQQIKLAKTQVVQAAGGDMLTSPGGASHAAGVSVLIFWAVRCARPIGCIHRSESIGDAARAQVSAYKFQRSAQVLCTTKVLSGDDENLTYHDKYSNILLRKTGMCTVYENMV